MAKPRGSSADIPKQPHERRLAADDDDAPTPVTTPGVVDGWGALHLCAISEPGCSNGRAVAILLAALSSGEVGIAAKGGAFGKMDWSGYVVDLRTGRVGESRRDSSPGTIRYYIASQLPDDLYLSDIQIDERDLRYWLNMQTRGNTQTAALSPTPVEHEPQSAHGGASFGQSPAGVGAGTAPQSAARATAPSPQAVEPSPLKFGNAGGRPRKWDWDGFARELVRLANTLDGLPDRPATTKHMKEWCALEWGDEPADSVIRDRIARLYPNDS
jgi:hypothetical protein